MPSGQVINSAGAQVPECADRKTGEPLRGCRPQERRAGKPRSTCVAALEEARAQLRVMRSEQLARRRVSHHPGESAPGEGGGAPDR